VRDAHENSMEILGQFSAEIDMHAVCYWIYGVEIRSMTSRKRAYLEELWLRNVTAAQAV
jgi:hypothetical protein